MRIYSNRFSILKIRLCVFSLSLVRHVKQISFRDFVSFSVLSSSERAMKFYIYEYLHSQACREDEAILEKKCVFLQWYIRRISSSGKSLMVSILIFKGLIKTSFDKSVSMQNVFPCWLLIHLLWENCMFFLKFSALLRAMFEFIWEILLLSFVERVI